MQIDLGDYAEKRQRKQTWQKTVISSARSSAVPGKPTNRRLEARLTKRNSLVRYTDNPSKWFVTSAALLGTYRERAV